MTNGRRIMVATGALAVALLAARATWAQTVPLCSDTTMFPNPVYLAGSTAYQPTAGIFAVPLANAATAADRITVIYQNGLGSCDGPPAILNAGTAGGMLTGTATTWVAGPNFATDPTSVTKTAGCTLDGTHAADVGISDVFWTSCPNLAGTPQPTTIKDFKGPVQAMIFVVSNPQNTGFTALSAEEGQLLWGCGPGGMVTPFDDVTGIQQRSATSGSQGLVAKAINVPPGAFFGHNNSGGGDVVTSIMNYVGSHDPNKAIGFIAGDLFDQKKSLLFPVAFQAFHQTKAYYADSTRDGTDRKNVRDGHYGVWGPEHFFATVDGSGNPTSQAAAKFLGATFGTMYQSDLDYVNLQTLAGVIPQCAMKVTRSEDGGPMSPNTGITDSCSCFYEKTRTGNTSCTACPNGNGDCSGGKSCHHGYCE